ncbi:TetR/AcrR family transcriptional regulator [Kordiimonas sp. SCSIO 12610]|uniref:TetR/AcrR family transcriptional regulator n=1 Tax=Kordiimonas sp. SCSIO 12610 TaxID=2829597 RepID=UPI00210A11C8|nr:TetR/AcrR family transcriptional regulator [Kordiimonas sp. SCSIO 12610]UTW54627.1 TetR/AcrR family transcriptional regulator [Kordiimonas sp. SCSIO 12610]
MDIGYALTPAANITAVRKKTGSKRELILCEAIRQFNHQGYYDTRLEDIGEAFGLSKTSISYHFKNKERLLENAYAATCNFMDTQLADASTESNGLAKVIKFFRSFLEVQTAINNGTHNPLALMSDLSGLAEEDQPVILTRYQQQIENFRAFLEEGISDNSISVQSVDAATFFAFNVLQYIPSWLETIPPRLYDQSIDEFCDLMTFGLSNLSERPNVMPISRNPTIDFQDIFDRNARNNMKRDAFLRTGIRYLNRSGYRNLSLDDIAAELGVTRGALYYQIADKETFLIECFNRSCDLIEKAFDQAQELGGQQTLPKLESAIRLLFENHITEHDPLIRQNLINMLDKASYTVVKARINRLKAQYVELLAQGMLDNSIRTINMEAAEHIIFGTIFAASGRRFAATQLGNSWHPHSEPVSASASYFDPLITGFANSRSG